jgi:hypothetical protein
MQLLKTAAICVLLSLGYASASAQTHPLTKDPGLKKAELFSDLPQRMEWNSPLFAQLLEKEVGALIRVSITPRFTFSGTVVSKSSAADVRSKTIVIKSGDRAGAALTITGILKEDGSYKYSGRMLSLKHSDAFEIVEEDGRFALQKRHLDDLVSE